MLMKERKLQLIQNFCFQTVDDVIYHILNVCQAYSTDVKELDLHIAGLVDKNSALFREISKDFRKVTLETRPENFQFIPGIEEIPAHFFSHLFAIAACV